MTMCLILKVSVLVYLYITVSEQFQDMSYYFLPSSSLKSVMLMIFINKFFASTVIKLSLCSAKKTFTNLPFFPKASGVPELILFV
jgi:hypothetical protein